MIVTAKIDVSKPIGRRIVKDLENKRCVELQFENPKISGEWRSLEDVIERGFDKLTDHYGIDVRALTGRYSKYYMK
jgi:hypothetical protein